MAQIMIQKGKLLGKACFWGSLFCGFIILPVAFGHPLVIDPWRPDVPPKVLNEPNATEAGKLIEKLTYSKSDIEHILRITSLLEPNDATQFLQRYIAEYSKQNKLTDDTWGRAVFCLGIVQTEQAKDELLRLWDTCDHHLASGKIKIELSDSWKSVSPLRVIGDAIHFYLWDDKVRQWFIRRIDEAEKLPEPKKIDIAKSSRRIDREQLLLHLYRWDIIESVDEESVVTPEKISRFYRLTPQTVKNISKAAERVVYWVKPLHVLHPDITEEQWLKIRRSPREYMLDEVAPLLGRPLALAIWEKYLNKQSNHDIGDIKHRLWFISLGAYLNSFMRTHNGPWVADEKDNLFLEDATAYVTHLPDGHIRKLTTGGLFAITCYAPEDLHNEQFDKIRALSNRFISEGYRRGIILNVENNKRTMKKLERNN